MSQTPLSSIKSVVIIFNPNSTGDGEKNARRLAAAVRAAGIPAKVVPTTHAGHGKTLAREYAERPTPTMIISSSGDGGYNEVINGVLASKNPDAIVGVLPSGNANDHYHYLHRGNTVRRIVRGDYQKIDVLQMTKGRMVRYAHSYIGLGMTPQIGEVLTKNQLNVFKEAWLVVRHLFTVRPVKIHVHGHTQRYDHLVFSNIARMSKYLKINDAGTMTDGEFEVIKVASGSLLGLLRHLFAAASVGASADDVTDTYQFTCLRDMKIQLDGEVVACKTGEVVTITSCQRKLRTIV